MPLAMVPRNGTETAAASLVQKVVKKEEPYAVPVPDEVEKRAAKHGPGN